MATTTETAARTYHAVLYKVAPYPLNWDSTDSLSCDSLEAAMAKVEEWKAQYPKGFATRTRWAEVTSDLGFKDIGTGSAGYRVKVGLKKHLNTKKAK